MIKVNLANNEIVKKRSITASSKVSNWNSEFSSSKAVLWDQETVDIDADAFGICHKEYYVSSHCGHINSLCAFIGLPV